MATIQGRHLLLPEKLEYFKPSKYLKCNNFKKDKLQLKFSAVAFRTPPSAKQKEKKWELSTSHKIGLYKTPRPKILFRDPQRT